MKNSAKDRQDHKLHNYLAEHDKAIDQWLKSRDTRSYDHVMNEIGKKHKMYIPDLHKAIRLTVSTKGPADNSRAARKHEVKITKERVLKPVERRELEEEITSTFQDANR